MNRILLCSVCAFGFVVVCALLFVQVQQRLLRYDTANLLSDFQFLYLGQSTFQQADRIRQKWAKNVWYEKSSVCKPSRCEFGVFLRDLSYRHQQIFERRWVLRTYEIAGGHPTAVGMRLSVQSGVVWSKSFGVGTDLGTYEANGKVFSILLEGNIYSSPRVDLASISALHPEYRLWMRDRNPNLNIEFTPYAPTEEIRRLAQFNLDCITRRRRCGEPAQLMPNAWKQLEAESAAYKNDDVWTGCNAAVLELFSRDVENAAIVSIVSHGILSDSTLDKLRDVTLRMDERMKRANSWEIGATRTLALSPNDPFKGAVGTRWIVLFGPGGSSQRAGLHFEPCTPLPLNERNLDIVRRGMARDTRPADLSQ